MIIIGTICLGFCIQILVILASKSQKKFISRFKFWYCWQQKCYRNPFLGHLEPPKEYGRHCHRYLVWEKSIFFGSIGSQKGAKNAIFLQGGQNLPPAICRVNFIVFLEQTSPAFLFWMKKYWILFLRGDKVPAPTYRCVRWLK